MHGASLVLHHHRLDVIDGNSHCLVAPRLAQLAQLSLECLAHLAQVGHLYVAGARLGQQLLTLCVCMHVCLCVRVRLMRACVRACMLTRRTDKADAR